MRAPRNNRLILLAMFVVLVGCHQPGGEKLQASTTEAAPAVLKYKTLSNSGTYSVSYSCEPDPIPVNEFFSLEVAVVDSRDPSRPVGEVVVVADASMPAHRHGMNTQPEVRALGKGRFTVAGMLFHMPGHWELYFDITHDAVTERAQFDIDLE